MSTRCRLTATIIVGKVMSDELQVSLRDKFYMPPEAASELCMASHSRLALFYS